MSRHVTCLMAGVPGELIVYYVVTLSVRKEGRVHRSEAVVPILLVAPHSVEQRTTDDLSVPSKKTLVVLEYNSVLTFSQA